MEPVGGKGEPKEMTESVSSMSGSIENPSSEDKPEKLDLDEAQTKANFIRYFALAAAGNRIAQEEAPDDFRYVQLANESRRHNLPLGPDERLRLQESEDRVLQIRNSVIYGTRSVEPTASEYAEAERDVQIEMELLNKGGAIARLTRGITFKLAEIGSESILGQRSKKIQEREQGEPGRLDLKEAQREANLIHYFAFYEAGLRIAAEEIPDDFQFVALIYKLKRQGFPLSADEQSMFRKCERRVFRIRDSAINGERPVEPTSSEYANADIEAQQWLDTLNKGGKATKFVRRVTGEMQLRALEIKSDMRSRRKREQRQDDSKKK